MSYFPMFVNIDKQKCLIIGGGNVALRKVQVLKDFGAEVVVIAPKIMNKIKEISNIICIERSYKESDIEGNALVVAATDDIDINHDISQKCNQLKIPVNAVDQEEDCSFIFPSYIKKQNLVAAFSSAGKSPVMTQYLKAKMTDVMTEYLGELTECLGSIRDEVKERVDTEKVRKQVYQDILLIGLENEELPTIEQMRTVIEKYE